MMGLRKDRHVLTIFAPFKLGQSALKSRIVMASMTRGRTTNPGHVPNELQVEYYRQRASAGLILAEGTWVSGDAIGFINVPGLFTPAAAINIQGGGLHGYQADVSERCRRKRPHLQ
jgi:2,4-dienoyl-CoA reductase-like NADH-dependent reductase (Old Yellow Enzyme family)